MLKRLLAFTKEYLSLVAIVPLILGGIWQIFSLGQISPAYIRFFSVSQQVAYGLIILCVLIVLYAIYINLKTYLYKKRDSYEWAKRSYSNLIFRLVFLILLCFITSTFTYSLIKTYEFNNTDFYDLIKFAVGVTVTLVIIYNMIILLQAFLVKIFKVEKKEPYILTEEEKKYYAKYDFILMPIISFLGICFIIILFFYFEEIIYSFHKSMSIPKNLKNKDYIISKYRLQNHVSNNDSLQIIYMNDKYIFIQVGKEIDVVKFDYMFRE